MFGFCICQSPFLKQMFLMFAPYLNPNYFSQFLSYNALERVHFHLHSSLHYRRCLMNRNCYYNVNALIFFLISLETLLFPELTPSSLLIPLFSRMTFPSCHPLFLDNIQSLLHSLMELNPVNEGEIECYQERGDDNQEMSFWRRVE